MGTIGEITRAAVLPLLAGGCMAAAVAGVGAVALTERGAQALVDAPVSEVVEDTRAVFDEMGIEMTDGGDHALENDVTVRGRRGEMQVTVEIERETENTAEVQVVAREGALDWDRRLAGDILRRIVDRS